MKNELIFEIKLEARDSFFVECLAEHLVSGDSVDTVKEVMQSLFGSTDPGVVRLQFLRAA